jgi:hypothetical protein
MERIDPDCAVIHVNDGKIKREYGGQTFDHSYFGFIL